MPSNRKFYRTVISVEVLSEEPKTFESLADVAEAIDRGDCSGRWDEITSNEELDGPTAAQCLMAQGSDPGFFMLTDDGEDTE